MANPSSCILFAVGALLGVLITYRYLVLPGLQYWLSGDARSVRAMPERFSIELNSCVLHVLSTQSRLILRGSIPPAVGHERSLYKLVGHRIKFVQ